MDPRTEVRGAWRARTTEPHRRSISPPEERSHVLVPSERYLSADFARREFEGVFMHAWNLVCREEELLDVGDYHEFTLGGQSVVLVKATDDGVKAFHNVCLHRGMQLCRGSGTMSEIRCGYHSWCWNLDGSLNEVIDPYEYPPDLISPEALHLRELRVETWGGFYFINFDKDAPSLLDHLGQLVPILAPYKLEQMRYQRHWRVQLPVNWKIVMDNFSETYHFPTLHPQTMPLANEVDETVWPVGDHTVMRVPVAQPSRRIPGQLSGATQIRYMLDVPELVDVAERAMLEEVLASSGPNLTPEAVVGSIIAHRRSQALALDITGLSDEQLVEDWDVHIFPNVELNVLFDQVFGYIVYPDQHDPRLCTLDIISLVQPQPDAEYSTIDTEMVEDYRAYPWIPVIGQDMNVFERVQIGIQSRAFPGMRFSSYRELGLLHTHETIDRWLNRFG
jgi:phenylpropionate dioxygenase-like ring-hydroxylating dioxygenase large terminal subunit